MGAYSITVQAKSWDAEKAVRIASDIEEAIGKYDGETDDVDIEWIEDYDGDHEPNPSAAMWQSLFDLDVGMGRVTCWADLIEEGWNEVGAAWIIKTLDDSMWKNPQAWKVWATGPIPEVDGRRDITPGKLGPRQSS